MEQRLSESRYPSICQGLIKYKLFKCLYSKKIQNPKNKIKLSSWPSSLDEINKTKFLSIFKKAQYIHIQMILLFFFLNKEKVRNLGAVIDQIHKWASWLFCSGFATDQLPLECGQRITACNVPSS